jgi:mannose-1-phosphate guanylyltransferase/mannose-6-phosphate isomerase
MFQQTLMRLNGLSNIQAPIIVCNHDHRFMVADQLTELGVEQPQIILEPVGRDTAPALAIAALQSIQNGDDPSLLVLAADHVIQNTSAFHRAIKIAEQQAEQGFLVTFGIAPTSPNTGYGYIQADGKGHVSAVKAFVEKPNLATAEQYMSSGDYYWNSGMFMFKASTLLAELERHSPEILQVCQQALSSSEIDLDFIRLNRTIFSTCKALSIDYAVMEHTDKAMVVTLDAGWNDVGSWSSLWECANQDVNNNVVKGDVILDDVRNAYVHSESRLVSVLGLEDIVIVETADAVMVTSKEKAQDVKNVVKKLVETQRSEAENHRRCYRPWGFFDSIDMGERFQVKRITVKPGASLSLQLHHHRAEHWVVVSGTAHVTCEDKVSLLGENESTYIPLGKKHRLHNPGNIPLEIIEVQSGSYLGEDDIIRFDDNYRRR